jgi:hypothetical protein
MRARLDRWLVGPAGGAAVWALICAWTALWGWDRNRQSGVSWHFFTTGTQALFGGSGLHLYARHPDLQIGPLAFVVVELLGPLPSGAAKVAAQVLMTAVGPVLLLVLAPLLGDGPGRRRLRLLLAGLALAPAWTVLSVRWMHLEDVLALLLSVVAVRFVAQGSRSGATSGAPSGVVPGVVPGAVPAAGLALGAAMAAKPWAAGFAPILLAFPLTALLEATACAAVVALGAWGPFVLADHGTLDAFRPPVGVSDSSGLWTLGYRGSVVPSWGRTAQLVLAPVVALGVVVRRRWPGVLLVAFAVRLTLDPQDIGYYAAGAVLAALVFDLLVTGWTVPWAALVTWTVQWQPFAHDFERRFSTEHGMALWFFRHPHLVGVAHLLWAAAAVLLVVVVPGRWLCRGTESAQSR